MFLSAIEGNAVEVTNENFDDLWTLCDEFPFRSLLLRVRSFKETPTHQIERQNASVEGLERQFEERSQHFQMQEASHTAAIVRLTQVEIELAQESQAQEAALKLLVVDVSAFQD
jgi:hypothetical protein